MKTLKLITLLGLLTLTVMSAQTVSHKFDTVTELNVDAPSGSPSWLSASFTNIAANHVRLKIQSNLAEGEFIGSFAMNLNPSLDLDNLTFVSASYEGSFELPTITKTLNGVIGGQGTLFDIGYEFTSANAGGGNRRFNQSDSVSYDLFYSGTGQFDYRSFGYLDENASRLMSAHVQSIGENNTSAWITTQIPEPTTAALSMLGCFALLRRRK